MAKIAELERQQIIDLHKDEGWSIERLRKKFKRGPATIEKILVQAGIEVSKGKNKKGLDVELVERWRGLYNSGNNFSDIARLYNTDPTVVRQKFQVLGLYDTKAFDTTDEQKQLMNQLYKSGLSSRAVAEKMNLSKTTVLEYLDGAREPSSFRIYSVNEDFFENIDNQEKAYWLGVLYADGYNSEERRYVRFGQAKKDKELVYKFKNILEAEHPVVFNERHGKVQDFYQISVSSVKLSRDLARHGCMQNKTFKTEFPNIPEELYSHFIRGYFDGDGSIWNSSGYPNISITGNIGLLERIQEILMEECQLNKTKLISRRKNSIVDIRYGGRNQVRRIYDYLYKDATTFLSRKHNILNNILNKSLDDNR